MNRTLIALAIVPAILLNAPVAMADPTTAHCVLVVQTVVAWHVPCGVGLPVGCNNITIMTPNVRNPLLDNKYPVGFGPQKGPLPTVWIWVPHTQGDLDYGDETLFDACQFLPPGGCTNVTPGVMFCVRP